MYTFTSQKIYTLTNQKCNFLQVENIHFLQRKKCTLLPVENVLAFTYRKMYIFTSLETCTFASRICKRLAVEKYTPSQVEKFILSRSIQRDQFNEIRVLGSSKNLLNIHECGMGLPTSEIFFVFRILIKPV